MNPQLQETLDDVLTWTTLATSSLILYSFWHVYWLFQPGVSVWDVFVSALTIITLGCALNQNRLLTSGHVAFATIFLGGLAMIYTFGWRGLAFQQHIVMLLNQ